MELRGGNKYVVKTPSNPHIHHKVLSFFKLHRNRQHSYAGFPTHRLYLGRPPRYINGRPGIFRDPFSFFRPRPRHHLRSINLWTMIPRSTPPVPSPGLAIGRTGGFHTDHKSKPLIGLCVSLKLGITSAQVR